MRLPRCSRSRSSAGHLQPAGPAHPHHVGAEVREHHRGVRTGADAAEFDHFHPGKGSGVGHRSNVTQPPFSVAKVNIVTFAHRP